MQLSEVTVVNESLSMMVLPAHTSLIYTIGANEDGEFVGQGHTQLLFVLWDTSLGPQVQGNHLSDDPLISSWSAAQDGSNVDLTLAFRRSIPGWVAGAAPGVGGIELFFNCRA